MLTPAPTDPLLGCVLDGRYEIHEKLGEGGMGTVYRATHVLMGKACAVKVLRGPAAAREMAGKRFQREAQSASRLDHENCIRVTDFGITSDHLMYLVMELLEGRTLAAELATRGAMPVARALAVAQKVARALAHAHGLGIVHRDLKPDNIFLSSRPGGEETVKVLDFGLAKLLMPGAGGGTLSEVGTVFGTPEYMSPEQAESKELDARADLYSFGIVLYQAMTGMLPFQGNSFLAVLTKHLTETPVSPAERRPDLALPPALVALTMRCLEKDPALRPPSAGHVVDELSAVELQPRVSTAVARQQTVELEAETATAPPEPAAPVPVVAIDSAPIELPPPAPRWPLYLFLLVPVAALAAVWMAFSRPPKPAPPPTQTVVPAPTPLPAAPTPPILPPLAAAAPDAAAPPPATEPPPGPRFDHLREADRYRRQGNRIKELYHLQQAVRLDPQNREALFRLGAALIDGGQHDLGCQKLARAGAIAKSLFESSGCASPAGH